MHMVWDVQGHECKILVEILQGTCCSVYDSPLHNDKYVFKTGKVISHSFIWILKVEGYESTMLIQPFLCADHPN